MKTLDEIDDILCEAYQSDLFVDITLMPGLGFRYNKPDKTAVVTYPKLEFEMPKSRLIGRIVEISEGALGDCLDGDAGIDFETDERYSFLLKHSEIEDCKVLPFLLYPWLYNS